jgi:hypothetical protein
VKATSHIQREETPTTKKPTKFQKISLAQREVLLQTVRAAVGAACATVVAKKEASLCRKCFSFINPSIVNVRDMFGIRADTGCPFGCIAANACAYARVRSDS